MNKRTNYQVNIYRYIQIFLVRWMLIFCLLIDSVYAAQNNLDGIKSAIDDYNQGSRYSLPLASHWNTDEFDKGPYGALYQIKLMENGEYILPWVGMRPVYTASAKQKLNVLLKYLNDNQLPVSIVSTQWESLLLDTRQFGINKKINLIDSATISSNSVIEDWHKIGSIWGKSSFIADIGNQLPNPPLVVFLSNNEQPKETWATLIDKAQLAAGAQDKASWENKRKAIGDKWIDRYSTMINAFRQNLPMTWTDKSLFAGYDALGNAAIGRWPGWLEYSIKTSQYAEPWEKAWEGSSSSYYLYDWNDMTDFKVMSPQVESMNYIYLLNEAYKINPKYWFELSIWDGYVPQNGGKRTYYKNQGQNFDECRYKGFSGFGAWLLRPRVLREFRYYNDYSQEKYFKSILSFVKDVHETTVLSEYWLNGELLENPNGQNPYNKNLDSRIISQRKWYLLDVTLNKPQPWKLDDKLSVFALALKNKIENSYLIYAYSPESGNKNVNVTIPGYGDVNIKAMPSGSYFEIKNNQINEVKSGNKDLDCPA